MTRTESLPSGPSGTSAPGAEAALLFNALGEPRRMGLVVLLSRESPQSISGLAGHGTISRQAVTKHLQILEDAGVAALSSGVQRARSTTRVEWMPPPEPGPCRDRARQGSVPDSDVDTGREY